MFEDDFENKLKEKIELANLLFGLNDSDTEKVHLLYQKKKNIIKKNSLFSGIQINKINKQINKIRQKYDLKKLEESKNNLDTNSIFEPKQNK